MIVFDHLAPPNKANPTHFWDHGADGSYDALNFSKRNMGYQKGVFLYRSNVLIYEPSIEKYDSKELQKQAFDAQKRNFK